mmetsp:Transcript_5954/g.18726  ORF Transcript_5954/g.18726 Transcript_5954/m.18726 type:complete len:379 (-) Transcript_5954:312-1448(-)
MLQDSVRTDTYRRAIVGNASDFENAVVLDVGSGTGILAFFAAQAGAGRIYAVEASAMAEKAMKLAASRGNAHLTRWNDDDADMRVLEGAESWAELDAAFRLYVVRSKVEDAKLPEKVDVVISEPLGFLLVHERMLEAFVVARDRFLKPDTGKMMPSTAVLKVLPVSDQNLWAEQVAKANFWTARSFYGVDLSDLHADALEEYFSQAVVGYFSLDSCLAAVPCEKHFDFSTLSVADLRSFSIRLEFEITKTALCHGLGCWFDAHFLGSDNVVTLSTGPAAPGTHWYQCRLLLQHPVAVNVGQVLQGNLLFTANEHLSYDLQLHLALKGTHVVSSQNVRLDDQMYHYLQVPPPHHYGPVVTNVGTNLGANVAPPSPLDNA